MFPLHVDFGFRFVFLSVAILVSVSAFVPFQLVYALYIVVRFARLMSSMHRIRETDTQTRRHTDTDTDTRVHAYTRTQSRLPEGTGGAG